MADISTTIDVTGSEGTLVVDQSGAILSRDPEDAYASVASVDMQEYRRWCESIGETVPGSIDILLLGLNDTHGGYDTPEQECRDELEERLRKARVGRRLEERSKDVRQSYDGVQYPFKWNVKLRSSVFDFDKLLAESSIKPADDVVEKLRQFFHSDRSQTYNESMYSHGLSLLRDWTLEGVWWSCVSDKSSFQFGFVGRSDGWLVLKSYNGWDASKDSLRDLIESSTLAELLTLEAILMGTDALTSRAVLTKTVRNAIGTLWFTEAQTLVTPEPPQVRRVLVGDREAVKEVIGAWRDIFRESMTSMAGETHWTRLLIAVITLPLMIVYSLGCLVGVLMGRRVVVEQDGQGTSIGVESSQ